MENNTIPKHNTFYAIGLNYKKADAEIRGKFSIDAQSKSNLLQQAKTEGIESLIVTSTCNRTEIYGFAQHPFQLIKLLCENSKGTVEDFQKVAYVYKNQEAISHLFKVGTGLDSQILGDFEIISQIKIAFTESKALDLANSFMERLVNSVIQASKRIKTDTDISSGATSVSFASVQYIMKNVANIGEKNILLFGTGKIGRNTCENLVKHSKNEHITLINRTKDKAEKLAGKLNLIVKDYADLHIELQKADVLVVATGAQNPTIDKAILNLKKPLLILDLSIPKNVNSDVNELENVTLVHLDDLSQITDETLEKRKLHIPAAEAIIEEIKNEFSSWMNGRKYAPTIHALKAKLNTIKEKELIFQRKKLSNFDEEQAELISNRIIQKITNHFANHLKDEETMVDESIDYINKIFQL
ncbi:glutamyl-tRNA reductase [Flavobacterium psychrophilum]|jgi:glutamyl-tRNA reductase|uniref:Glutamyl-tRNA reductase n=2 Tax=Flavobacterium psychrophilum TaxID=96345 RepID=HEM1_FLAPJ|nr:glutamyl-tRNA reductase [Flavobacterium psychrophilum]A6GVP1.1 RecName: Full=Glutamyl-tRNA reductase; Short=GluTR [Flavobacterium psychrophilum JIP02/86]AIG28995.1 glutamyl-tRNA reductase [Flavobacterium psychrophilum]AIG31271.1 glutamyl-tRNA reductase [Flavobacterium psychrophilum]AIG35691.1 glutamyl-tRNA reductase [Flavobacterium psychrophilum]AIG35797.1 glutamyl-tRNA reductase [Flavobacterium psychrophilum]AIG38052.1 glutamyl-tRNA reductase [Flavobacterium psychrophilum]